MNIKEAKEEVIHTVQAYLHRDETGEYAIPPQKQRPILLMGPPGIGKTAIMEQVARELHINLVSYTITHHTRQSAIGLPFIVKKTYGGREMSVTEYTMSEIVASVYDRIEETGISEGILFLDEINCVSETLSPTMLQFLQYKKFGTHQVPAGFVIVTAGNPPQYNRSVRDFDIVTLDRVRRIDIEEDFLVWKEYARREGVHGSILAYLQIRQDHFYRIRTETEGRHFVTARGWEDLSRSIAVYEELGIPVTEQLVGEYLQDPEIAQSFAAYYALYNKYRRIYQVPEILEGRADPSSQVCEELKSAPFDEKLSLLGLLIDALTGEFRRYAQDQSVAGELFSELGTLREHFAAGESGTEGFERQIRARRGRLSHERDAGLLSQEDERTARRVIADMEAVLQAMRSCGTDDAHALFAAAREWFAGQESGRQERIGQSGDHLTNTFRYLHEVFGDGQEMVLFLSEMGAGYFCVKFVSECGNEAWYRYNRLLLLDERRSQLRAQVLQLVDL